MAPVWPRQINRAASRRRSARPALKCGRLYAPPPQTRRKRADSRNDNHSDDVHKCNRAGRGGRGRGRANCASAAIMAADISLSFMSLRASPAAGATCGARIGAHFRRAARVARRPKQWRRSRRDWAARPLLTFLRVGGAVSRRGRRVSGGRQSHKTHVVRFAARAIRRRRCNRRKHLTSLRRLRTRRNRPNCLRPAGQNRRSRRRRRR